MDDLRKPAFPFRPAGHGTTIGQWLCHLIPPLAAGGSDGARFASNDAVSLAEDTTITIDVLANDTWTGKASGTPATINIVTPPTLGAASILNGGVFYQPGANLNGTDSFGYTITVGTQTSPMAFVSISITAVNDPPTAVSDSFNAVRNVATQLAVLANDIDPDGAQDLKNAIITAPPTPAGATATVAGGIVMFTATSAGTYTFRYRAVDAAGVQSGNEATVTVVVADAEAIAFVRSNFIANKLRWRIDGTDTILAGQTITVTYDNGTRTNGTSLKGFVIGTAVVDPTGAWSVDLIVGTDDLRNVGNASPFGVRPTTVRATSSLSGAATQTNPIALR